MARPSPYSLTWLVASVCLLAPAASAQVDPGPSSTASSPPSPGALDAAPAEPESPSTDSPSSPGVNDGEGESGRLAEARQRFDRGLGLYQEGEYDLALIEFDRAYELVPDYRVLYNIAQVGMMLGRYARARQALEQYLSEAGESISPERRREVEIDLTMLQGRTATLSVRSNVEGSELLIDQDKVGTLPMDTPVLLNAGSHSVVIRAPGYTSVSQRVTLAGRDAQTLLIELVPEAIKERERIVVEKQIEATPSESPTPALVWAGWIATGTLATGAAVTGILGIDAAGELDSLRDDPDAERRDLNDAANRAKSLFLAADLLGAAALLAGGASLYFTLFDGSATTEPGRDGGLRKTSLSVGPSQIQFSGQF